jgi:hypothetical protein
MNLDREFLGPGARNDIPTPAFGYYEYRLDLGLVNDLWLRSIHCTPARFSGAEYMLTRKRFTNGKLRYRFGAGGGCQI